MIGTLNEQKQREYEEHAERVTVAELFAGSKLHAAMSDDESAGFPQWLMFAGMSDVRELKRHLEAEQ